MFGAPFSDELGEDLPDHRYIFEAVTGESAGDIDVTVFRVLIYDEIFIGGVGEYAGETSVEFAVGPLHVVIEVGPDIAFIFFIGTELPVHIFRFVIIFLVSIVPAYFDPGAVYACETIVGAMSGTPDETGEILGTVQVFIRLEPGDGPPRGLQFYIQAERFQKFPGPRPCRQNDLIVYQAN